MTVKIKWSLPAFEQIRRDPALGPALEGAADRIAAACGPGYESSGVERGKTRSRAAVFTETAEAMADNATNNTLIANLSAGR